MCGSNASEGSLLPFWRFKLLCLDASRQAARPSKTPPRGASAASRKRPGIPGSSRPKKLRSRPSADSNFEVTRRRLITGRVDFGYSVAVEAKRRSGFAPAETPELVNQLLRILGEDSPSDERTRLVRYSPESEVDRSDAWREVDFTTTIWTSRQIGG